MYLMDRWRRTVTKWDLVYVLGDAAFTDEGLQSIAELPGRKKLVRGNHDKHNAKLLLRVFEDIHGIVAYKRTWLSHAPIHPQELRGRKNIHGHVHFATIPDDRYINVSAEAIEYTPVHYKVLMGEPLG